MTTTGIKFTVKASDTLEIDLVRRAQDGNQGAFSKLMDLYRERIYRLIYHMVGSLDDSHDLCQETFVRAYRALNTFDPQRPFKPWIYRIANNVILDHFRQKKVRPTLAEPNPEQPFEETAPDLNAEEPLMALVSEETRDRVWSAIQALPENYKNVVLHRYVDDLSYAEIAETLGLTVQNVMMRMSRARQILRERLQYLQIG